MKRLYFDLGNTRVKWWNGLQVGMFAYSDAAEAIANLRTANPACSEIISASVVKDSRWGDFLALCAAQAEWSVYECVVTAEAGQLRCGYEDISRLGIDRWLAVVAGWTLCQSAFVVADLGTAATVDFVDDSAAHLGGYIVPGLHLGIKALLAGTNNVVVDTEQLALASRAPGTNTGQAVAHGALAAIAATIEVSLARHQARYPDARLLLTGGDSQLVARQLGCHYQQHGDLVFIGMQLLHDLGLTRNVPTKGK